MRIFICVICVQKDFWDSLIKLRLKQETRKGFNTNILFYHSTHFGVVDAGNTRTPGCASLTGGYSHLATSWLWIWLYYLCCPMKFEAAFFMQNNQIVSNWNIYIKHWNTIYMYGIHLFWIQITLWKPTLKYILVGILLLLQKLFIT